jgi:uncharacterized protein (DUF433 family)
LIPALALESPLSEGSDFRWPDLLGLLAAGSTRDQILADYPYLEREDIDEGLQYAALLAEGGTVELAR